MGAEGRELEAKGQGLVAMDRITETPLRCLLKRNIKLLKYSHLKSMRFCDLSEKETVTKSLEIKSCMNLYFQGAFGLTEDSTQLLRWMICEQEVARCINEFESFLPFSLE